MRFLSIYTTVMLLALTSYSQNVTSIVDSSTRSTLLKQIFLHKDSAPFQDLYNDLSTQSKIVKVFDAAIVKRNKENIDYDFDFMKYFVLRHSEYLIYNQTQNGLKIVGTYDTSNPKDLHIYPSLTTTESFLEDVSRYYNIDSVTFIVLYGIPGICVMVNKNIWIIDGNERTELVAYLRKHYKSLSDIINLFILYE